MPTIPGEPAFDVPVLLARERGALMATLTRLAPADWERRTSRAGWTVRDVVSQLWSADLAVLARLRDGHAPERPGDVEEHDDRWVAATRHLSPRVLVDRLRDSGPEVTTLFRLGDASVRLEPVPWAGPDPAPLWFSGACELTARFVQQHRVRAAVGHLPFDDEDVLAAVVDTVAHAFPVGLADTPAAAGTTVRVEVHGAVERAWTFVRGLAGWRAVDPGDARVATEPAARLRTDGDTLWRLLTGTLTRAEQVGLVEMSGTPTLFAALRDTRAVPPPGPR